MTEINWNKYIGIPYAFNKSTYDSFDCLGLLRLFYREQGWKETFDDGKVIEKDWYKTHPLRFIKYLCRNFDITRDLNELSIGDILYMRIAGEGHVAIYTG